MLPVVEQPLLPCQVLLPFVRRRQVLVHEGDDDVDKLAKRLDRIHDLVVVVLLATRGVVDVPDTKERPKCLTAGAILGTESDFEDERFPRVLPLKQPSPATKPARNCAECLVTGRTVVVTPAEHSTANWLLAARYRTGRPTFSVTRWLQTLVGTQRISPELVLRALRARQQVPLAERDGGRVMGSTRCNVERRHRLPVRSLWISRVNRAEPEKLSHRFEDPPVSLCHCDLQDESQLRRTVDERRLLRRDDERTLSRDNAAECVPDVIDQTGQSRASGADAD
jgi:hypothetical protein